MNLVWVSTAQHERDHCRGCPRT